MELCLLRWCGSGGVQTKKASASLVTSLYVCALSLRIAIFWFRKQERFFLPSWSIGFSSSGSNLFASALRLSSVRFLPAVPLELSSKTWKLGSLSSWIKIKEDF